MRIDNPVPSRRPVALAACGALLSGTLLIGGAPGSATQPARGTGLPDFLDRLPLRPVMRMVMVNRLSRKSAEPDLAVDTLRANILDPRAFLDQINQALRNAGFREQDPRPARRESLGGVEQETS